MPNRILREGILTSPRIAKLGWPEEVFYRRLMSVVDDFGRYYADPGLLRAACYPRQLNKVSDSDIGKWLACVQKAALVRVYPAQDGERYLELLDFGQQVRAKKSKFPDPRSTCVADATHPLADAPVFEGVFEDEDEGVFDGESRASARPPPKPPRRSAPRKTPLPDGFGVSERVARWAAEKGHRDLDLHLEHFVGKAKAKGYTYADWDEAFMNAIRDNWAGVGERKAGGRESTADHNKRAFDEWEAGMNDGRTIDA